MKYCPKCGSQLIRVSKFCPECGYDLVKLEADPAPTVSQNDQIRKNIEKLQAQISKLEAAKQEAERQKAEEEQAAQEQRIAEERARLLAEQKALEETKLRIQEEQRLREERERLEQERLALEKAEEERKAREAEIARLKQEEEARLAEEKRIAEEKERRLAEKKAQEEAKKRLAEEKRLKAEAEKAEKERLKAEKAEAKKRKREEKLARRRPMSKGIIALCVVGFCLFALAIGLGVMAILFTTVLKTYYYAEKTIHQVARILFMVSSILLGAGAAGIGIFILAKFARKTMLIPVVGGVIGLSLGIASLPLKQLEPFKDPNREDMQHVYVGARSRISECPFYFERDPYQNDNFTIINMKGFYMNWDTSEGKNWKTNKAYYSSATLGNDGYELSIGFDPYIDLGYVSIFLVEMDCPWPQNGEPITDEIMNKTLFRSDPFLYDEFSPIERIGPSDDIVHIDEMLIVHMALTDLTWHEYYHG